MSRYIVRFEVSSPAAIASAVSGFRVRRSTWMIWNSRSARLMAVLFFTAWLADADSMLAAGGQYTGTSLQPRGFFVHDDSVRPRPLDNDVAAADTTVAAGN